jgi:uncharacterized protein
MVTYFDTSALVKRYDIREAGAPRIQAFFSTPQIVYTSALTLVEMMSAFRTKQRTGEFTTSDMNIAIRDYNVHSPLDYKLIHPQNTTLHLAERLVLTYKIRAYDAVHVATALTIVNVAKIMPAQLEFYTSDKDQAAVAQVEGITVTLV